MLTMAETASDTITIAASPDTVWAIATDIERYPEWARDVKDVVVTARDGDGRPSQVEFRTSALGRSTHFLVETMDLREDRFRLSTLVLDGGVRTGPDGHREEQNNRDCGRDR